MSKRSRKLEGKTVLITGGGGGMGLKTAKLFAEAGCIIILTDINKQALKSAKEKLAVYPVEVTTRVSDVTDREGVEKMLSSLEKKYGGIDILINNAGIGYQGELKDTSLETWQKQMDINFWGPLYHIYALLPGMISRRSGHIVNIASGQAFYRLPTWGAYAVVKLMFGAFSEVLHYEIKKYNVNVTTVYPYLVNTGFYSDVESVTLAQKLAMKNMPLYSYSADKAARIIFEAVLNKKDVEDMHPLTTFGRWMNAMKPLYNLYNNTAALLMTNSDDVVKEQPGKLGFTIEEVMSGEHEFLPGKGPVGKRPISFRLKWGTADILRALNPATRNFMVNDMEGTITVDGLCEDAPCKGKLELKYIDEQKIKYAFDFVHKGKAYRYEGEKSDIRPWNLHVSHTTCVGTIKEIATGELISTSVTHFHWDTLPEFIRSFKFRRA